MASVFISYRRKPSAMLANLIARELRERHRIEVYLDTERMDTSRDFSTHLTDVIRKSDVFLCLVAEGTFESELVQREIQVANEIGKPLIPVFQESYNPLGNADVPSPHIRTLLEHDGVLVFDIKNVYIDQSIEFLARVIENTVSAKYHQPTVLPEPADQSLVGVNIRTLAGQQWGQYELHELIGMGGMAAVYRAYQPSLQRYVALKLLPPTLAPEGDYTGRFIREAQTAAQLEHAHIIPIYDYGIQGGIYYLVMRLMTGGSLAQRLERIGGTNQSLPSLQESAEVLKQLARALDYAHSRGVIHRDIKASNVMFDDQGSPFLGDFGIARLIDSGTSITGTGFTIGTPLYMAPEQWRGESVTAATDQYALGIMAYTMVTGRLPFEGQTPYILMSKHLHEPPTPLQIWRSDLPTPIEAVFSRVLAKPPLARYPSVADFATAFAEAVKDVPASKSGFFTHPLPVNKVDPGPIINTIADLPALASVPLNPVTGQLSPPNLPNRTSPTLADSRAFVRPASASRAQRLRGMPVATSVLLALIIYFVIGAFNASGLTPSQVLEPLAGIALLVVVIFIGYLTLPAALTQLGQMIDLKHITVPPKKPKTEPVSGSPKLVQMSTDAEHIVSSEVYAPEKDAAPAAVISSLNPDLTGVLASAPQDVQLTITQTPDSQLVGKTFKIDHTPFTIGRINADLNIDEDANISRQHAEIVMENSVYYIIDTGSANGTILDGKLIRPEEKIALMFGMTIRLGMATTLVFGSEKMTSVPNMVGRTIKGRYQVTTLLKKSGKAAVYSALDKQFEREVAIKVLSPDLASYPGYREQFDREAETAARLKHPHIVEIYDYGTESISTNDELTAIPFISMKLLNGGTLAGRLEGNEGKVFPLEQIAGWIESLADALHFAHRQNIVHSGIKPGVIIFDDDKPYLSDFAIAQHIGGAGSSLVVGAPAFVAPEQWEDEPLTDAIDQYALAAITYLLVTGERPFNNQDVPSVRKENYENGALPAHQVAIKRGQLVPSAVSGVLAKALSRKPQDRYESVREFAQAFSKAITVVEQSPVRKPEIFISYQRDSSAGWAIYFRERLYKEHNITVFVDTQRLDGAVRFPKRLREAIENCDVFVCLLAEKTLDSKWVCAEIELAHTYKKPMVPVFQESFQQPAQGEDLPSYIEALLEFDAIHLMDRKNIHVEYTIQELAKMIHETTRRFSTKQDLL